MHPSSLVAVALAASTTMASAVSFKAYAVYDQLECAGDARFIDYRPTNNTVCRPHTECTRVLDYNNQAKVGDSLFGGWVPKNTSFSTNQVCSDDHFADADKRWHGQPYVVIEYYRRNCSELAKVFAMVANGECVPHDTGASSSRAVFAATNMSFVHTAYADANCSSLPEQHRYSADQVDHMTCVVEPYNSYRVFAVKPGVPRPPLPTANPSTPVPTTSSASGPRLAAMSAGVFVALVAAANVAV